MFKRKRSISALALVFAAACLSALAFLGTAVAPAHADWQTGQTSNLLPALDKDSDIKGLGFTFSHSHAYEMVETSRGSWGIRPSNTYDDIGDGSDYSGGMYYTYTLSEADCAKAAAQQLTISTSAWYYIASVSQTTYISLNISFLDSNDGILGDEVSTKDNITRTTAGTKQLSLPKTTVPATTAKIKFRWSAVTNGAQRPWVAEMDARLYDGTAPAVENISLTKTVVDSANNIAIKGNTLKYYVEFNEKVSVTSYGTAKLGLDGKETTVSVTTGTLTTENGKSKVCYTFRLPELTSSGKISLYSVSGLSVTDEAGNSYTYTKSGISSDSVQYYKTMRVTYQLTNLSLSSGESTASYGKSTDWYTAQIAPKTGYELPKSIEITVGGVLLAENKDYSYKDKSAAEPGVIIIHRDCITGDIIIKAVGVAKTYTVSLNMQGGADGSASARATYDSAMPAITVPTRAGYTFGGYYTETNGGGTQYYKADGTSAKNWDIASNTTLYAKWTANKYTVTFDMQNGTGGSTSIAATYDSAMPAITIPARTGYTFGGYYTETNGGGTQYYKADGTSAKNWNIAANATLYAKWTADKYTVTFDMLGGTGGTASIAAIYDSEMPVITIPARTGYAFGGYYTAAIGGTQYYNADGTSAKKWDIASEKTLYAHWTANEYSITYKANQPANASGNVIGSTTSSKHTYDNSSELSENGYSLVGWSFMGWAETENGAVKYGKNASVINLATDQGAVVTLYAVWQANEYSVKYEANRPAGASALVKGSVSNSKHTYDKQSELSQNGYSLLGWSFKGWAETAGGAVKYENGESVKNLTAVSGDTVVLYAVWQANSYVISFDTDGGSLAETVGVKYDGKLPGVIPPARKGYNFKGYFSGKNGSGVKYYDNEGTATVSEYTTDGNLKLYADWSPIIYNIELYSDGKYVGIIKNVVYGKMRLPSAETLGIERANFNFVGWNLYADQNWSMYSADTDYSAGLTGNEGETVVLYAAWLEKDRFTISYDANGGTGAPAMTQAHEDETIIISDIIPSRKNYTFGGWAVTASGAAKYNPNDELKMGSAPITLYAVWIKNPSLSYDFNGGSFGYLPETVYPAAGETVIITEVIPTLNGYAFAGWSDKADAVTADYHAGDNFVMPLENVILYAVYTKAEYSVSYTAADGYAINGLNDKYYFDDEVVFTVAGDSPRVYIDGQLVSADVNGNYSFRIKSDVNVFVADGTKNSLIYSANGGTGAPYDRSSYDAGSTATVSSEKPKRTGYTFAGWSADESASGADYTSGDEIEISGEDVILYAVWNANVYNVVYDANGGDGSMNPDEFSFGTAGALSKIGFEKEGKTFAGWALSENGNAVYADGATVENLRTENGDSITLYAVWKQTVTQISFAADGGSEVNSPLSVAYGDELNAKGLIIPERIGYIFAGYLTEAGGAGELVFDADLNVALSGTWNKNVQAITLYPYWIPVSYTVVYINGQKISGRQSAVYDSAFNLKSANNLGIVAPEGYHFAGWSVITSGKIVAYADEQLISSGLTQTNGAEVLLYAVFDKDEEFSVVYNANGGTNAPVDNNTYLAGARVTFGNVIPAREGYIFAGWSYNPNKTDIDFAYDSGVFTPAYVEMPSGGLYLYAVWTEGETLQAQINAVKDVTNSLSGSITALEADYGSLSGQLTNLKTQLENAQSILDSLGETYATKQGLADAVAELNRLISAAQTALEEKIQQVQDNLDKEVKNLKDLISGNTTKIDEIQQSIADLDKAYKDADTAINEKLGTLFANDTGLESKINNLQNSLTATENSLKTLIENVKKELLAADEDLKGLISDNTTAINELKQKISDVEKEYAAADGLLKSEIMASVNEKDKELNGKISALQEALKTAQEGLQSSIETVKNELLAADAELRTSISGNTSSIKDIEKSITDLDEAYKKADVLLKSDIMDLVNAKDKELDDKISDLQQALKTAQEGLQASIDKVKEDLLAADAELRTSISGNTTDIGKLRETLAKIEEDYKKADELLKAEIIASVDEKDEKLDGKITELQGALKTAQEGLQSSIDKVKKELDEKVSELNDLISANKTYIDSVQEKLLAKLSEVEAGYLAADLIINGKINSLIQKDAEIDGKISSLKASLENAEERLKNSIDKVQTNLDKAVEKLNLLIAGNASDIEALKVAINELRKAYQTADAIINGEIASLKEQDKKLAESIAALNVAYQAADEALWAGIKQVQKNLDDLQKDLDKKDGTLNNRIDDVIASQQKTALYNLIIEIVLGAALIGLIVALVIKSVKKKSAENKKEK